MLRIVTAQPEIIPGNIRANWALLREEIEAARALRADILVLPEMCLTGYLIGDLWDQTAFLRECETYNRRIAEAARGLVIVWGSCAVDWERIQDDGRVRKYNAAFAAAEGRFLTPRGSRRPYTVKTLLPNYRQFDDRRYFTPASVPAAEEGLPLAEFLRPFDLPVKGGVLSAGVLLCEDSWDENYAVRPMDLLAAHRPDIFLNLSSSPFTLGKNEKRHRMLSAASARLGVPMLYINHRGLQNNGKDCYTFDGMTAAYKKDGTLAGEAAPYEEARTVFLFDPASKELAPETPHSPFTGDLLLPALRYGVSHFLSAIGASRAVIGVSGGIDSAVNAALYRSVLPADSVLLVNTPTKYNSETTKGLAADLAGRLGSPYTVIPIGDFIGRTAETLSRCSVRTARDEQSLAPSSFMLENMQARDRSARILAALSASFGGIFTCNANKTEFTAGYATLYGDMAGALAATADLWKHQIYRLGRLLNDWYGKAVIPEGIFTIRPSAELSDSQAVEKGLGDPMIYDYHDYLFRSFVEPWERKTPEDILRWYAEGTLEKHIGTPLSVKDLFPAAADFIADLEKWWNLFAGFAVAKRIQSPPLIAVSRRPYGYDLREAQLRPYYTDAYLALKEKLLS